MRKKYMFFVGLFFSFSFLYSQQNDFQVVAQTKEGGVLELYKECHALVIGVSDYTEGWPDLSYACVDADEVGDLLFVNAFEVCGMVLW